MNRNNIFSLFILLLLTLACDNTRLPKPYGYIRGEFPEKSYISYPIKEDLPYSFKTPKYSVVVSKKVQPEEGKIHQDITYPKLKAMVNLTYLELEDEEDLKRKMEYVNSNVYSHSIKASRIKERYLDDTIKDIYGVCYYLDGPAASNCQFYLHDGKDHFARGVLYFMSAPNPDSLAPYIDFIRTDIDTLINSWNWENR